MNFFHLLLVVIFLLLGCNGSEEEKAPDHNIVTDQNGQVWTLKSQRLIKGDFQDWDLVHYEHKSKKSVERQVWDSFLTFKFDTSFYNLFIYDIRGGEYIDGRKTLDTLEVLNLIRKKGDDYYLYPVVMKEYGQTGSYVTYDKIRLGKKYEFIDDGVFIHLRDGDLYTIMTEPWTDYLGKKPDFVSFVYYFKTHYKFDDFTFSRQDSFLYAHVKRYGEPEKDLKIRYRWGGGPAFVEWP